MFIKSNYLLLSVIMSLLSMACQKESITTTPSEVLVKTKSEGNNMETYFYDSQKRLAKIVFTTATGTSYYHEYTYSGNEISEYRSEEPVYALEQTLPGGAVRINCTSNPSLLKLNERGLYLETASNCQSVTCQYDDNGFLITHSFGITDYSINEQLSNDRKNILSVNGTGFNYLGGDFKETTSYEYYKDKLNTIGNKNFGKQYLGKSSENLLKSSTKNGETTSYTYILDAQQRVSTQTTIKGSAQTVVTYTYY
jgi:YD repeat-containing protein